MKNIVASVGIVALGTTALQAAESANLELARPARPFKIAATVRGFYDDNPSTLSSDNAQKEDSFGFELSPTIDYTYVAETTTFNASYVYSIKYYDTKPVGNADHADQTHSFNLGLEHQFNPQYLVRVKESFVIGQEPDMLRAGSTIATPYRVPGDNIRNYAALDLEGNLSREFGFGVGYDNAYYDYADDSTIDPVTGQRVTSLAGTLNRMEHGAHLDGKWLYSRQTTGVLGFRFRETDYTGDQFLGGNPALPNSLVESSDRNNRLYSPNIGADHEFTPDLTASIRGGATYADYYNSPTADNAWTPYILLSGRYLYAQESYVELGVSHDLSATDIVAVDTLGRNSTFTQDSEVTTVFATVNHRFTERVYGSLTGQYQYSTFNGGSTDGESENFFMAGVNVEYRFTHNLSSHIGYNFDSLDSDLEGRNYVRNRVYIGLTGSY
jgi:hypothetical protein